MAGRRDFRMSPAAVMHMIKSQSGTLEKAIAEYVMNSADAKATAMTIDFVKGPGGVTGIVVADNGCGFKSEKEIDERFGEFGFDHSTAEEQAVGRKYGRFGIGRGQMWAFGSTVWETNKFRLDVDVENRGLNYRVDSFGEVLHAGCKITVKLYKPLSLVDHQNTVRALTDLVCFCDLDIRVDGKQVAGRLKDMKWDETIPEAYIQVKPNSTNGVRIYNQGVFVQTIFHYQVGFSGILVSRKPMVLNMARNDVLRGECPVWKAAGKVMRKLAGIRAEKKNNALQDDDRNYLLTKVLGGEMRASEIWDKKLCCDVRGLKQTLSYVERHNPDRCITVAPQRKSQVGEHIFVEKMAYVADPSMLDVFQADDGDELVQKLDSLFVMYYEELSEKHGGSRYWDPQGAPKFRHIEFSSLQQQYGGASAIIPKPDQKSEIMLGALSEVGTEIRYAVNCASGIDCRQNRRFLLGESDRAQAWTDGNAYIAITKRLLNNGFSGDPDNLSKLLNIVCHEYLHPENSGDEHCHGPEFFEAFESVLTSSAWKPFEWIRKIQKSYMELCEKAGIQLNKAILRGVDQMQVKDISVVGQSTQEPETVPVMAEAAKAAEPPAGQDRFETAAPAVDDAPVSPRAKAKPAVRVKADAPKEGSLAAACLKVIDGLGGQAPLSDIYDKIKGMGLDKTGAWKASVRKTVQNKNWFVSKGDGVYASAK